MGSRSGPRWQHQWARATDPHAQPWPSPQLPPAPSQGGGIPEGLLQGPHWARGSPSHQEQSLPCLSNKNPIWCQQRPQESGLRKQSQDQAGQRRQWHSSRTHHSRDTPGSISVGASSGDSRARARATALTHTPPHTHPTPARGLAQCAPGTEAGIRGVGGVRKPGTRQDTPAATWSWAKGAAGGGGGGVSR